MAKSAAKLKQSKVRSPAWTRDPLSRCVARAGGLFLDALIFGLPIYVLSLLVDYNMRDSSTSATGAGDTGGSWDISWITTPTGNAVLVYVVFFLGRTIVEASGRNTWGHQFMGVWVSYPTKGNSQVSRKALVKAAMRNSWVLIPVLVWAVASGISGGTIVDLYDFIFGIVALILVFTLYRSRGGLHIFDRWAGADVHYGPTALGR